MTFSLKHRPSSMRFKERAEIYGGKSPLRLKTSSAVGFTSQDLPLRRDLRTLQLPGQSPKRSSAASDSMSRVRHSA